MKTAQKIGMVITISLLTFSLSLNAQWASPGNFTHSGSANLTQVLTVGDTVGIGTTSPGHILHVMDGNSGASQPQGYGPVTQTPSMVVVNGGVAETVGNPDPKIAEFRAQREAVSNASIAIRGSRDGSIAQDISYVEYTNYDQNEGSGTEYEMARAGGGMETISGQTGYFFISTNEGDSLTRKVFIDKDGFTGIGTPFSATNLPLYRLDVMGTMGVEILPYDSIDQIVVWDSTTRQLKYRNLSDMIGDPVSATCTTRDYIPKFNSSGDLACSQIQDDGTTVGIAGISNNFMGVTPLKLYVNGNAAVTGTFISSDARYKKNIRTVKSALEMVQNLRGVTYSFRHEEFPEMNFKSGKSYGLIAQEVEEVMPDVVITSKEGYKAVNYDGMIPVLIEALKEQQSQIDYLQAQLDQRSTINSTSSPVLDANPVLLQNRPNPFTEETIIEFNLDPSFQQANIHIFDMQGTQLDVIPVNITENGNITIHGHTMEAGMYLYSLIADGEVLDTKTMILTK